MNLFIPDWRPAHERPKTGLNSIIYRGKTIQRSQHVLDMVAWSSRMRFTTSPTLKFCCFFSLFKRSRCDILLSSVIIFNVDIVNWKFVFTSRKYLNNAWLLSEFKVPVGNSYVSIVHINYLPTAAMLRITLVSLIGSLFYAYWNLFRFWINTLWLPKYCPVISCDLFRNQGFSTLFPLWLPLAKGHNYFWRNLQITLKAPRNRLSLSTTTTANMPNYNTTSSINNLTSYSDLVSVVIDYIMNCVKPHIVFCRWYPSWFLYSAVPGDHMSRCIIQNIMVTGQENCNYFFLLLQIFMICSAHNLLPIAWNFLLILAKRIIVIFCRWFYILPYALDWVQHGNG